MSGVGHDLGFSFPQRNVPQVVSWNLESRYPVQYTANRFQERTTWSVLKWRMKPFKSVPCRFWQCWIRALRTSSTFSSCSKICLSLYVFHDICRFFEIENRNANAALNVLVCFGFEPPNKFNFSYARYKVSRDTSLVCVSEICGNLNMIGLLNFIKNPLKPFNKPV